jgi:hypothetical protein
MVRHVNQRRRTTKVERMEANQKIISANQRGRGMYVFRNRSKHGTLSLPKPAADGRKVIGPNGEWEGDDYFMQMVKQHEAIFVREVRSPAEDKAMEDKLILDQPDTVTTEGPVEHVVVKPNVSLNETPQVNKPKKEVLLTEDPMSGVQIILD